MKRRIAVGVRIGLAVLALTGFSGWALSLPSTPAAAVAPVIAPEEYAASVAALREPKRERPLLAVAGINDATETTNYLMTYGILRRADVVALATRVDPVRLYPALTVEPYATIAEFDAAHPDGADYVIGPAMDRDHDPVALASLQNLAAKGTVIVNVCAGAKVLGPAGLLDGGPMTTH